MDGLLLIFFIHYNVLPGAEDAYTPVSNRAGSRSVLVAVFSKNQYNESQQNFKGGVFGAEKEKEQIPENDDY